MIAALGAFLPAGIATAQDTAGARDGEFYAALRGGLNWTPDQNASGSFSSRDDRDSGWAAGGAFGYDFKPIRLELEYLFRRNDLDGLDVRQDGGTSFALGLAPLSGEQAIDSTGINTSAFMVNAIWDVPVLEGVRPFFGAGLGLAVVDLDYRLAGGQNLLESDEAQFAVQGLAGLSWPLTRALTAEVSYRYLITTRNSVELAGGIRSDIRYEAHSLLFGLRYAFGGAPKKAEPVAPPPAPAPVNRAPVAGNDQARVRAGESVNIPVLANDSDPDGRIAGIATIGAAAHGEISRNADGTLRYSAEPRFVGRDSFDYTIQDDGGAVATARVTIDVLPPEVGPFLVFFDFDSAGVRADAAAILDDAAEAWRKFGIVRLQVIGHTDRSGPASYNQGLSERRAAAIRAELVQRGIPPADIVSLARGESEPLVPTGDGVREPQNRRVEITFPDPRPGG